MTQSSPPFDSGDPDGRLGDSSGGFSWKWTGRPEPFDVRDVDLRGLLRRTVYGLSLAVGLYLGTCSVLLVIYRFADPPTTGVQIQRRVQSWMSDDAYQKRYEPVPLSAVDDNLELAVVAAEDTRFFQHTGIDWKAIREAIEDNRERGRVYRGGSTITQQLVKNLFQTTHSSFVRKGLEVPLTYAAEIVLPKERILELYLNVIEWGPGVYGVEAASRYHYDQSASSLSRYRAAALAACIPNPLVRRPHRMHSYASTILGRMHQLERIQPRFQ